MIGERERCPYGNVNWRTCKKITGCTHMHCLSQQQLDNAFASGLELVSITNYYPSRPWYPLREQTGDLLGQKQFGFIRDGVWHHKEISFGELFSGEGKLPPPEEKEAEKLFTNLPPDLLEIPNTEHHDFADTHPFFHITAPGSLLSSGTPERVKDAFGLFSAGFAKGCPLPWREAFTHILEELLYPEGGGIIIDHPAESRIRANQICEMLDFDSRVLGMEVYNSCSADEFAASAELLWDEVLSTRRQCFGFCAVDQPRPHWRGKIVLLAEERTPEACLKAMRQGNFYGKITGDTLDFEEISFDGRRFYARTNSSETLFRLIAAPGIVCEKSGREFSFLLPGEKASSYIFLRLDASLAKREMLYAQPIMLD